jgi:hypothetical protein
VGIPACLAVNLEALHCLETAERILDGTCEDVVDTRVAVSGRGAFEEYERGAALAFGDAAMEQVFLFP